MSLGLARVRPREAARVQVPWATSLAMNFALRARLLDHVRSGLRIDFPG